MGSPGDVIDTLVPDRGPVELADVGSGLLEFLCFNLASPVRLDGLFDLAVLA